MNHRQQKSDSLSSIARDASNFLRNLRESRAIHYIPIKIEEAEQNQTKAEQNQTKAEQIEIQAEQEAQKLRKQARSWSAHEKLDYLRTRNVGNCQRCPLAKTRTHIVFGVGNPEAELMLIGEAPGFDEDRQGEPFVGRAGQRLNQWLRELGMAREDVYIANVLKCRPPGNRDPQAAEVEKCSPFLHAQIRAIEPKVIVALGRYAGMLLLGRDELTLRAMRGRTWNYEQGTVKIPLIVTYHPSYVLRQETEKQKRGEAITGPGSVHETVMTDLRQAATLIP